nr:MAG TPA: hypothetical protein [Caudoviricetes sp.]
MTTRDILIGLASDQETIKSLADHLRFIAKNLPDGKAKAEVTKAFDHLREANTCIEYAKRAL